MSEQKINPEHCAANATAERPRDIADLSALVVSNLTSYEPGEEDGTIIVFVWRDCAMTFKFPYGQKMFVSPGHGETVDSTIREIAVGAIAKYCEAAAMAMAEIRVHMVPPELSTGDQIFAWFQSIPDISIRVLPPEEIGFGGPLPPAGAS